MRLSDYEAESGYWREVIALAIRNTLWQTDAASRLHHLWAKVARNSGRT